MMRVRHPLNVFAVNETRINLAGFSDLALLPIVWQGSYSLDLEKLSPPIILDEENLISSYSAYLEKVRDIYINETNLTSSMLLTIYDFEEIEAEYDAQSSTESSGVSVLIDANTLPIVHTTNSLLRMTFLANQDIDPIHIQSTFKLRTSGIWFVEFDKWELKLEAAMDRIVRTIVIKDHKQYIDGWMGIPSRLNVVPMPVKFRDMASKGYFKYNTLVLNMPLSLDPVHGQLNRKLDAQRIRQLWMDANCLCEMPDLSIIRFTLINLDVQPKAIIDFGITLLMSLDLKTDLLVDNPPTRIQLLRNGLPGSPIPVEDFSKLAKYRHIIVDYDPNV